MAEAFDSFEKGKQQMSPFTAAAISNQTVQESMRLLLLIRAYQVRLFSPGPPCVWGCNTWVCAVQYARADLLASFPMLTPQHMQSDHD